MRTYSEFIVELHKSDQKTSVHFPKTALREGSSLEALGTLASRYVQLRLIARDDLAASCVEVMRRHLETCSSPLKPLRPYIVPDNVDRDSFRVNSKCSPEWFAKTLTEYELLRFQWIHDLYSSGRSSSDLALRAVSKAEEAYGVMTSLERRPDEDRATWQFVRMFFHANTAPKATEYCRRFWPSEGTWRPRSIQSIPESELQTQMIRLLALAADTPGVHRKEIGTILRKTEDLLYAGLADYFARLEYALILNSLDKKEPALNLALAELRQDAS